MGRSEVSVSVTYDGYLVTSSGNSAQRWVEIAPHTFRQVDGHGILKFVVDDEGKVLRYLVDQPAWVREPAGLYEKGSTVSIIVTLAVLSCLGVLIGAWLRRKQTIEQSSGERYANLVLIVTASIWLVFGALGPSSIGSGGYDFPSAFVFWRLVIALVGVALTAMSLVLLYPVWSTGSWRIGRRLRHTVIVLLLVNVVPLLHSYNLNGFNYFS